MTGGLTSVMHRLTAGGLQHVVREMTVEPWASHAEGLLTREAWAQRLLDGGPVPVPRCVAADPTGAVAGVPVLLMTGLPGRPLLDHWDERLARQLAQVLLDVHRTRVPPEARPRRYQSWAGPGPWDVPAWAANPRTWESASALASCPAPVQEHVLLHRDPNPSNFLWDGGFADGPQLVGVVDWVETSWGPADLDVAHCAKYVAMLHGADAADQLVAAYEDCGGRLADDPVDRAWWTATVVLALRGPERGLSSWRDQGLVTVSSRGARGRVEEHLRRALVPAGLT